MHNRSPFLQLGLFFSLSLSLPAPRPLRSAFLFSASAAALYNRQPRLSFSLARLSLARLSLALSRLSREAFPFPLFFPLAVFRLSPLLFASLFLSLCSLCPFARLYRFRSCKYRDYNFEPHDQSRSAAHAHALARSRCPFESELDHVYASLRVSSN